jgi:hypothetical protein
MAGGPLAGVLLASRLGVFSYAYPSELTAAKEPRQLPDFHAAIYSLDLLIPAGDLNYQGSWVAHGWAQWLWLLWILLGWILTIAVIAAVTGLMKRD